MFLWTHLFLTLHPASDLCFAHSGTCQELHEIPFWQLLLLKFLQNSLCAFPRGLLPVSFGASCTSVITTISVTFQISVRCACPRGERSRPSPLPFLVGSCLNTHRSPNEHWPFVIQRIQSPHSGLFFALSLPFPFAFPLLGAPSAGLSSSRFLALKRRSLIRW